MIHFLDTDEGKEIAKKNLGVIGIKGIAITALGYGKLDKRMKGLDTGAQLYYMRNIGDWVSSIAAQGMPINTNGHKHDNIGYNDDNYRIIFTKIPVGSSIGKHTQTSGDDINYIISGIGKAVCDGVEEILIPESCHICFKGSEHSIINTGSEDLVILTIVVKK